MNIAINQDKMVPPGARESLEEQQYRIVGSHSAVKVCGWTKSMIKGEGGCYKLKFYGIMSNQCMQMTPSMSCANRCTFCWRGYKAPVSKEWKWAVDDPLKILEDAQKAHHALLEGFNGNPKANKKIFQDSKSVRHVALSLTGEPINYPRLNELLAEMHKQGMSTFLVTNAQFPDQLQKMSPVTQLYISLDAPTKEMLKEIDNPLFDDYWERLCECLEIIKERKERTTIRLTLVKEVNMTNVKDYAKMIIKGDPDFIEVKGYMFVGASRQVLSKTNMPLHEEVVSFSKAMEKELDEYEIVSEHIPSRVVMLAKKRFKIDGVWHTWIDFPKFHELSLQNKPIEAMEYLAQTPKSGLSGRGTLDRMSEERKQKLGYAFTPQDKILTKDLKKE